MGICVSIFNIVENFNKKIARFPRFFNRRKRTIYGGFPCFPPPVVFFDGKTTKGIRRTDTPRFALRARHSRESRRLRLRFSPLRSEKFLLRHYRSLPLQRPPDAPTGAQSVCVLTKQHEHNAKACKNGIFDAEDNCGFFWL